MSGNDCHKYSGEIFRSVPPTFQGPSQSSTIPLRPILHSTASNLKNDKTNFATGSVVLSSCPLFLEKTNFLSSLDSKELTDLITKFLLNHEINFQFKPNKYKFKCSELHGIFFVIRLYRNDSGLITIEAQNRSGCSKSFQDIFNELQNEISPQQRCSQPKSFRAPPIPMNVPHADDATPSNDFLHEKLTSINTALSSNYTDTQEIAVDQFSILLDSKNILLTSSIKSLLKTSEKILHDLIVSFWQLNMFISFHKVVVLLNKLYTTLREVNELVDYNITVRIMLEAICSTSQSIYVCESVAMLINNLTFVCPKVLIQNEIARKLFLAYAKHSSRDTFKNILGNFHQQLSNTIASITTQQII